MAKLNLDRDMVDGCRELAETIVRPVQIYINRHSTVSVERTVLRLLGFSGAYEVEEGMPYPLANLIIDKLERRQLTNGAATFIAQVKKRYPRWDQKRMGEKIVRGEMNFEGLEDISPDQVNQLLKPWIDSAIRRLDKARYDRQDKLSKLGSSRQPLKYVIVATGNIHEDVKHAQSCLLYTSDAADES